MNVHEMLLSFDNAWLEKEFSERAMVMQRGTKESTRHLYRSDCGRVETGAATTAVCRVLGRYLVEILPDDIGCSTHLAMNGYWELPITLAIAKHVHRSSRCIDVGANVGYFTVLLAAAMECQVTAWEPQRQLMRLLRRTINMNGLRDLVAWAESAASDTAKDVELYLEGQTANASSVTHTPTDLIEHVTGVPIDRVHNEPVHFVKIDTEGAEPEVMLGMERLIEQSPELQICMEFTPRLYGDAPGFLDKLHEQFRIQGIRNDGGFRTIDRDALLNAAEFEMIWLNRKE